MRRYSLFLLALLLPSLRAAADPSDTLVISHVTVIEVANSTLRNDQAVAIDNGRITSVAATALFKPPANAHILDPQGNFLARPALDSMLKRAAEAAAAATDAN